MAADGQAHVHIFCQPIDQLKKIFLNLPTDQLLWQHKS